MGVRHSLAGDFARDILSTRSATATGARTATAKRRDQDPTFPDLAVSQDSIKMHDCRICFALRGGDENELVQIFVTRADRRLELRHRAKIVLTRRNVRAAQ